MLHHRSQELFISHNPSLGSLNSNSHIPLPSPPANHHATSCEFNYFSYITEVKPCSMCPSVAGVFHLAQCPQGLSLLSYMMGFKK